jgi:hypothetical protein
MARTEAVFRWIFGTSSISGGKYELSFEATPNTGLTDSALRAREERETVGLRNVAALAQRLQSLEAVHQWLFSRHDAYAPTSPSAKPQISAEALASY